MLLAPFPSKKSFKSGLVKQEARRFSKIREETSSKPVANFFFLSFLTCQGHTRILYLGNLNLFYKRRPRPTVGTAPQIFRGIIFTILTHKYRLFFAIINLFLYLYLTLNHLAKINLLIWHKLAHEHSVSYNDNSFIIFIFFQSS